MGVVNGDKYSIRFVISRGFERQWERDATVWWSGRLLIHSPRDILSEYGKFDCRSEWTVSPQQ